MRPALSSGSADGPAVSVGRAARPRRPARGGERTPNDRSRPRVPRRVVLWWAPGKLAPGRSPGRGRRAPAAVISAASARTRPRPAHGALRTTSHTDALRAWLARSFRLARGAAGRATPGRRPNGARRDRRRRAWPRPRDASAEAGGGHHRDDRGGVPRVRGDGGAWLALTETGAVPDSGARAAARLTPPQLAARLDRILACTGSLIASVPAPYLEHRASPAHGSPGQDSTLRELAFHVFRLGLGFADGMDLGRVSERWFSERAPADLSDGAAVARYGALVRARLGGWFEGAGTSE